MEFDVLNKLFPNPLTLFTQLCATAVLVFFAYKLLWKPVRAYLDKRSEYMQSQLTEAEELKKESERLFADANKELKAAGTTAKEIVERGRNEGKREKETIVLEAQKEAELKLDTARKQIDKEKQQMRDAVRKEIVEVAFDASEKLLHQKLDDTTDKASLEQFIKEVNEYGPSS